MSATIDQSLLDRVKAIQAEIEQVSAAKPLVDEEVAAEMRRLEVLAARSEASASLWLRDDPSFSVAGFSDAVTAVLLAIEPEKAKKLMIDRARRQCAAWTGMRLAPADRDRRLNKLRGDLRQARAKLEIRRRQIEDLSEQ